MTMMMGKSQDFLGNYVVLCVRILTFDEVIFQTNIVGKKGQYAGAAGSGGKHMPFRMF